MKKSILFAGLFLIGISAQTFSQHNNNVTYHPGNYDRYYNSHEIRFVENGVLYSVAVDGTFTFRQLYSPYHAQRGRRNFNTVYYNSTPGAVTYVNTRPVEHYHVQYDRKGRIGSIGSTLIRYRRDGRIKSIGCVAITYHHGLVHTVGNMQVMYNRRGKIHRTVGHVNPYNKKYWHDDWYINNNDWDDDDWIEDRYEDHSSSRIRIKN